MAIAIVLIIVFIIALVSFVTDHPNFFWCTICVIGVALIFYGTFIWLPSYQCSELVESQGYRSRWGWFSGCQMNYNGRWIDYEKWRVFE